MTQAALPPRDFPFGLANAVILSSDAPMVLLSADMNIMAASQSFCRSFGIAPAHVAGARLSALGDGEWDVPQLGALLLAAASGGVAVEDYEMDLRRPGQPEQRLLINAHKLDYESDERVMVLLSITDITEARSRDRQKDSLVREKAILLEELQHRVANSLQIIASVLLQSARRVQSDETRTHIYDAHHRVMSVAALQHQLAVTQIADVGLRLYFTNLCRSIGASMIRDRSVLTIDVDVDDSFVKADVSLSLGLIVTELVINGLKHAFPGQRGGRIAVGYRADGKDWELTVRDDGIGLPEAAEDGKAGLGTSIVRALAMQLDAEIQVSAANPGTLISIAHRAEGATEAPGSA